MDAFDLLIIERSHFFFLRKRSLSFNNAMITLTSAVVELASCKGATTLFKMLSIVDFDWLFVIHVEKQFDLSAFSTHFLRKLDWYK